MSTLPEVAGVPASFMKVATSSRILDPKEVKKMPGTNYPGRENTRPERKPDPHPTTRREATQNPTRVPDRIATDKPSKTITPAGPNG